MNNYIVSCRNDICKYYSPGTKFNCYWADLLYKDFHGGLDYPSQYVRRCEDSKQFVCDVVEYEEK